MSVNSVINEIKHNLTVRVLLDPSMDLENSAIPQDQTQTKGSLNKQALVNRIKKLDDDTRLELMSELNRVLHLLRKDREVGPLQERGLCVVLLADDGVQANSRGLFDTIWQLFKNFFGCSASSETIIGKISEVQALIVANGIERPQDQMTLPQLGGALKSCVKAMHQEQGDHEASMSKKTEQFEHLKTHLNELETMIPSEEFDSVKVTDFVNEINDACNFIAKDAFLYGSLKLHAIKLYSVNFLVVAVNIDSDEKYKFIVDELQKNEPSLTKNDKNKLLFLQNKTQFSFEEKAFLRRLVMFVASRTINNLVIEIDVVSEKEKQKSAGLSKLIELVGVRQELLTHCESAIAASHNRKIAFQNISLLRNENEELSRTQDVFKRICVSVDKILTKSNSIDSLSIDSKVKYKKLKEFLGTHIQIISGRNDKAFNETHDYLIRLTYVLNVLNSDQPTLVKIADSFRFDKYLPLSESNRVQSDLYNKLEPFATQKGAFPLQTDEDRKDLAIAYLKYLKFLFSAEKAVLSTEIAYRKRRIALMENPSSLQLPSLNIAAAAAPVPQLDRPAVVPIPPLEISENPLDQLKGYAYALYHEFSNNKDQAHDICERLNGKPLSDYAACVYGNFYWLMKKNDRIKNDYNDYTEWGKVVFHASDDGKDVQNVFPEDTNQYRAKAMFLASKGVYLHGLDDPNINVMPPTL